MKKAVTGLILLFIAEIIQFIYPFFAFFIPAFWNSRIFDLAIIIVANAVLVIELVACTIAKRDLPAFGTVRVITILQFVACMIISLLKSFDIIYFGGVDDFIAKVFDMMVILFTIKVFRGICYDKNVDDKWFDKATIVILIFTAFSAIGSLWGSMIIGVSHKDLVNKIFFLICIAVYVITAIVSNIFWLRAVCKGIKLCKL